jgi:hypothetical protein
MNGHVGRCLGDRGVDDLNLPCEAVNQFRFVSPVDQKLRLAE